MSGAGAATAAGWEFDAGQLPEFLPRPCDGLILGLLPEPLEADSEAQQMLLSDHMQVDEDVMVGASIGIAQLAPVGLVVLHRRFTALMASRVAWAVGIRLRRQRLTTGDLSRVVMAGSKPNPDVIPDGVTVTMHRVRVRDHKVVSLIEVWEVHFLALVLAAREDSALL
ncbi:hypothetical protein [Frankia sp. Cppng1_Ct_nod]|uniref:hypothetical protein n=1 Tax=Frankia sp. Cppng1_Ct_nod TaxID=2897162 RepID=UPI0010418654|nr:hypothetical protein [Frankia sp. Cppng1_Ct_nod]